MQDTIYKLKLVIKIRANKNIQKNEKKIMLKIINGFLLIITTQLYNLSYQRKNHLCFIKNN